MKISIKILQFIFIVIFFAPKAFADVSNYYASIQHNPKALYAFFKKMPKGGELHYHFQGGAYPYELINLMRKHNYCLDLLDYKVTEFYGSCSHFNTKNILSHKQYYNKAVKKWSMHDLVADKRQRFDHFFDVFGKVGPIYNDFYPQLLAKIIKRAALQNELYMEIISPFFQSAEKFSQDIANEPSLAKKANILLSNQKFQATIKEIESISNASLDRAHKILLCDENPLSKACLVKVKFQFYVLRNSELNDFFTQALLGFVVASSSKNIVGVNLVQPENGLITIRDFKEQMHIFNYLHKKYPEVHIAIHAGELTNNVTKKINLKHHIKDAIFIGKAERIGHGVDIIQENNHQQLLSYMASHQIPVEINLTSNKLILSVYGKNHPILDYINHNVPIVLSTDDEGILQTNLTKEYVHAAFDYKLNYLTIKNINRNALTYSFLPGKSIWDNPAKQILIKECQELFSSACKKICDFSPKARLQVKLEKQLLEFEKAY